MTTDSHICYSSDADPRHCAVCGRELLQLTVSAAQSSLKPNYNMIFSNETGQIGTLDFNGPEMKFTGNAEESAKVFFDWVAKSFAQRLTEERRSQAKQIKILRMAIYHIIKDQGLNSDNAEIAHEALRADKEEGK